MTGNNAPFCLVNILSQIKNFKQIIQHSAFSGIVFSSLCYHFLLCKHASKIFFIFYYFLFWQNIKLPVYNNIIWRIHRKTRQYEQNITCSI